MDEKVRVLKMIPAKMLCRVALAGACAMTLVAGRAQAQTKPKAELATLTATAGEFQIRYPKNLLVCTHLDGENPDVWSREECIADIPVCDNSGHAGDVLACLAYPTGALKKSELQAAAFALSRIGNLHTAKECLEKWARSNTTDVHSERIAGMEMQAARAEQTESSHVSEQNIYRVFHAGSCYELDVNLTTAMDSAFAAEDVPRKLTLAEREGIKRSLHEALEGFRFLK
jgi:hypothetical protein